MIIRRFLPALPFLVFLGWVLSACNPFTGPVADPTSAMTVRFRNTAPESVFVQVKDGRRDRAMAQGMNNALGGISLPSFDLSGTGDSLIFGLATQAELPVTLFVLKTTGSVDVFIKPNAQEFSDPLASFPKVKVGPDQALMISKEGDKFSLK